jgi:Fic family protein
MGKNDLMTVLQFEKDSRIKGGIYHKIQVAFTYNSNHIEGSTLTQEQTRDIFETDTLAETKSVRVNDIIETANHFRCIDFVIDNAMKPLTEKMIKELHRILKTNTADSSQGWFRVGDYKLRPNEVGGHPTTPPDAVAGAIKDLLTTYNAREKSFENIIEFHQRFEAIHPFQDGNGRVGRLIILKECLANNIVPFNITDDTKLYYYRGLREWDTDREFLIQTCKSCQDETAEWLKYFDIIT